MESLLLGASIKEKATTVEGHRRLNWLEKE